METSSNELCRLCLEINEDRVNVFDNFEDTTIASILAKYFWFTVSKNDFSECVCVVCWTNVKSFHNFYKRVERRHKKYSVATEETNLIQQQQSDCILSQSDLNIFKCEEIGTLFEVFDLHIKNEECTDNDNNIDEFDNESSDDYDQFSNKSRTIGDAGNNHKSHRIEVNEEDVLKESVQIITQVNGENEIQIALEENSIRELFDLKCNICSDDIEFQTFKEFKNHHREIHQTIGQVKCCGLTFRERFEVLKHISQHSADRAMEDLRIREFYNFKCGICGDDKFQTFSEYKRHHSKVHKTGCFVKCCAKKMNRRCHLLEHMQYHLNPDEYRCDRCGKQFGQACALRSHMEIHTFVSGRTFSCYQCGKSWTKVKSLKKLKRHMQYKHSIDGKTFPCDQCNKVFPTNWSLKFHIRSVHSTSAALICDICAQSYKSKINFKLHMETHHATRPKVQCNVCGKWSANVYALRKHVRNQHNKHNDVKVNCPTCDKVIRNKRALTQHIRSVHCELKHKCPLCDKAFKSPTMLKEHVAALHTGEDLYDCTYCPKKFKSNANLYSHRKKIHFAEWSQASRNGVPM